VAGCFAAAQAGYIVRMLWYASMAPLSAAAATRFGSHRR
jgi:hypothetical protein